MGFCVGQILLIDQNPALFSLIGRNFGGDGITTFALPDFRSFSPNGAKWIIALEGTIPSQQ